MGLRRRLRNVPGWFWFVPTVLGALLVLWACWGGYADRVDGCVAGGGYWGVEGYTRSMVGTGTYNTATSYSETYSPVYGCLASQDDEARYPLYGAAR